MWGRRAAVLALVVSTCFATGAYKNAVWSEKMKSRESDLREAYAESLRDALKKEREGAEIAAKLEVKYHDAETRIRAMRADNDRLARELGGLRDKYAASSGVGVPARDAPAGTPDSAAPGRLSEEAARFLLGLAEDADRAAEYAATCHEWALSVRGRANRPPAEK